jgi:ribonuclease J
MKTNIAIAEHLQLTDFKHLIPVDDIDKYPPNKVLVILTGGQGENFSALVRLSTNEHRFIKLNQTDTIILSSSVIVGNEFAIERLKDDLYKMQVKLMTYADNVVHASGHGKREELRWLHKQIPAKFFMPIHGSYAFLKAHEQIALDAGWDPSKIIIPECNGAIIEFRDNATKAVQLPQSAVDAPWIVDGAYMGPRPEVVMEDRKILGTDGMFVVAVVLDMKRKMLVKSPDIASRGHTYLRESKELLSRTRSLVKRVCEHRLAQSGNSIDFDQLKKEINERLAKYIMQKTLKNPIIMTIITPINF